MTVKCGNVDDDDDNDEGDEEEECDGDHLRVVFRQFSSSPHQRLWSHPDLGAGPTPLL